MSASRFKTAERIRIVNEAFAPGVSVEGVARKYGVTGGALYGWRLTAKSLGLYTGREIHTDKCVMDNKMSPNIRETGFRIMIPKMEHSSTITYKYGNLEIIGPLHEVSRAVKILDGE